MKQNEETNQNLNQKIQRVRELEEGLRLELSKEKIKGQIQNFVKGRAQLRRTLPAKNAEPKIKRPNLVWDIFKVSCKVGTPTMEVGRRF